MKVTLVDHTPELKIHARNVNASRDWLITLMLDYQLLFWKLVWDFSSESEVMVDLHLICDQMKASKPTFHKPQPSQPILGPLP